MSTSAQPHRNSQQTPERFSGAPGGRRAQGFEKPPFSGPSLLFSLSLCPSLPVQSLPPLEWPLSSQSGSYELRIEVQPKPHHRAHYETEGSRGAVKAPTGGHPVVQVRPGLFLPVGKGGTSSSLKGFLGAGPEKGAP